MSRWARKIRVSHASIFCDVCVEQYHDGGLTGAMLGRRPVADVTGLPIEVAANPQRSRRTEYPVIGSTRSVMS